MMFNKLMICAAALTMVAASSKPVEHFVTEQGSIESGGTQQLWVRVTPEDGWKFNTDYPTKAKMNTPGYDLIKTEVHKEEESRAHKIQMTVTRQKGKLTREAVAVEAKFSVCSDTSCLVYKKEFTFCRGVTCK